MTDPSVTDHVIDHVMTDHAVDSNGVATSIDIESKLPATDKKSTLQEIGVNNVSLQETVVWSRYEFIEDAVGSATVDSDVGAEHKDAVIGLTARVKKPPDRLYSNYEEFKDRKVKELDIAKADLKGLVAEAVTALDEVDSCIDGEQHLLGADHANKSYHDPPLTRVKKPPDKLINIGQVEEALNKFVYIASVPFIVIKILIEQSQPSMDLLVL